MLLEFVSSVEHATLDLQYPIVHSTEHQLEHVMFY